MIDEYIDKVVRWAKDRDILSESTASKQIQKTAEELMELAVALGKDEMLIDVQHFLTPRDYGRELERVSGELADAIGDTLVTLIVVTEQCGLDLESCLQVAYNQIKDRKGKMVNGKFVKENS